jgi:hypothetical protein
MVIIGELRKLSGVGLWFFFFFFWIVLFYEGNSIDYETMKELNRTTIDLDG